MSYLSRKGEKDCVYAYIYIYLFCEVKIAMHVYKQSSFPNEFAIHDPNREMHLPVDLLMGEQQLFGL